MYFTHTACIWFTCDSHIKEPLISLNSINGLDCVIGTPTVCSDLRTEKIYLTSMYINELPWISGTVT